MASEEEWVDGITDVISSRENAKLLFSEINNVDVSIEFFFFFWQTDGGPWAVQTKDTSDRLWFVS